MSTAAPIIASNSAAVAAAEAAVALSLKQAKEEKAKAKKGSDDEGSDGDSSSSSSSSSEAGPAAAAKKAGAKSKLPVVMSVELVSDNEVESDVDEDVLEAFASLETKRMNDARAFYAGRLLPSQDGDPGFAPDPYDKKRTLPKSGVAEMRSFLNGKRRYLDMVEHGFELVVPMSQSPIARKRRMDARKEVLRAVSTGVAKNDVVDEYIKKLATTWYEDFDHWRHRALRYIVLATDWDTVEQIEGAPNQYNPKTARSNVRYWLGVREHRRAMGMPPKGQGTKKIPTKPITNIVFTQDTIKGFDTIFYPDLIYYEMKDKIEGKVRPVTKRKPKEEAAAGGAAKKSDDDDNSSSSSSSSSEDIMSRDCSVKAHSKKTKPSKKERTKKAKDKKKKEKEQAEAKSSKSKKKHKKRDVEKKEKKAAKSSSGSSSSESDDSDRTPPPSPPRVSSKKESEKHDHKRKRVVEEPAVAPVPLPVQALAIAGAAADDEVDDLLGGGVPSDAAVMAAVAAAANHVCPVTVPELDKILTRLDNMDKALLQTQAAVGLLPTNIVAAMSRQLPLTISDCIQTILKKQKTEPAAAAPATAASAGGLNKQPSTQ